MRITGIQLRRIIKEEVARMMYEEDSGGLSAARDIELAPYREKLPGGETVEPSMTGLYSQAGDRATRDIVTIMSSIKSTSPSGSTSTGAMQRNLNDVVLNRGNGQNLRTALADVLSKNLNAQGKFIAVIYALATGVAPPNTSDSLNATTNMNALMKMVGSFGYPLGIEFSKSMNTLDKIGMQSGSFMDDLYQVVRSTPPANLR